MCVRVREDGWVCNSFSPVKISCMIFISSYAVHSLSVEGDHSMGGVAEKKTLVLPVIGTTLKRKNFLLSFPSIKVLNDICLCVDG